MMVVVVGGWILFANFCEIAGYHLVVSTLTPGPLHGCHSVLSQYEEPGGDDKMS